jgi:hypothetical protein
LKQSFKIAFDNLAAGNWGRKQTQSFLDRECFVTDLTRQIIDHGCCARAFAKISEGTSNEPIVAQDIMRRDQASNPSNYLAPAIPFSWRIHDIEDSLILFPDVLMHLLFLGIVKSTLVTVKCWMSQQKMFTDFKQKAEKFDTLLNEIRLDWLPTLDYRNGGFGGWVSENFLAFSRVMTWFFQDIPLLTSATDDSVPPTERPNSFWKKIHYVSWLEKRGQRFAHKQTVAELKAMVIAYLDQEGGPPPIKVTVAGFYAPSQVEQVLVALQAMISAVMIAEVVPSTTCDNMEYRIKHFLAEFDLLDQQVKTAANVPKIISSFNFVCLLNLPKLTQMYGPLRNLWEGSFKGEGYIRHCKQFLRGGQRKNFAVNVVTHCLQETAYKRSADRILKQHSPLESPQTWSYFMKSKSGGYKVYTDKAEIIEKLSGNKTKIISVLACVIPHTLREEQLGYKLFCCIKAQGPLKESFELGVALYELEPTSDPLERLKDKYYSWHLTNRPPISLAGISEKHPFNDLGVTFGVMLPLLGRRAGGYHTLVVHSRYSQPSYLE